MKNGEQKVEFILYDREIIKMGGNTPIDEQVRLMLNKEGFVFQDDGTPFGVFTEERLVKERATLYTQEIKNKHCKQ